MSSKEWGIEGRREAANELMVYANLCNDEYGEMCATLAGIVYRYEMLALDDFKQALEREVRWHLDNLSNNARIVEEIEVREVPITRLEWES